MRRTRGKRSRGVYGGGVIRLCLLLLAGLTAAGVFLLVRREEPPPEPAGIDAPVESESPPEPVPEPEPEPVQVVAEPTVPDGFYTDLMEVQWAQLVCMYFILAAVLVTLGVSLWRCFANMKG